MKNDIISDLYNGKLYPCEQITSKSLEYQKTLHKEIELEEDFKKELTNDQIKKFESYIDMKNLANAMTQSETFKTGFNIGAKIIIEILTNEKLNSTEKSS